MYSHAEILGMIATEVAEERYSEKNRECAHKPANSSEERIVYDLRLVVEMDGRMHWED